MSRFALYWLPMMVIGFLNGLFRQFVLMEFLDEASARQASTLFLIAWLTIYTWSAYPQLAISSAQHALVAGITWVLLTFFFETGLGLVLGLAPAQLFAEYDITAGRLWPLALLAVFLLPYIFYQVQGRSAHRKQ